MSVLAGVLESPMLPYYLGLGVGTLVVTTLLASVRPTITERTVLAVIPWIICAVVLNVFHQLGELHQVQVYPPVVDPILSAPGVYVSVYIVAAFVWFVSLLIASGVGMEYSSADYLGATGIGVMMSLLALLAWQALDPAVAPIRLPIPTLGVILAGVITAAFYLLVGLWRPYVFATAGLGGALVLFAHVYEGVMIAIGAELFGIQGWSILPRVVLDVAADLPTQAYIGVGWLFVAVKLVAAMVLVWGLVRFLPNATSRRNFIVGFLMTIGLAPALNITLLLVLGL